MKRFFEIDAPLPCDETYKKLVGLDEYFGSYFKIPKIARKLACTSGAVKRALECRALAAQRLKFKSQEGQKSFAAFCVMCFLSFDVSTVTLRA